MSRIRVCLALFLFACFSAGCVRPFAVESKKSPDWRFGLIETYEAPAVATTAGAAWTRLRFHWADVQPEGPDSWKAPLSDERLDAEIAAGRLVVGLLIGIPDWARPDAFSPPAGLWLPRTDPENLWARFVRQAVSRYAGRIDHWIIWNEPDIWDKSAPGHTWDGTVEDFAQLQRVAYLVAKESNPEATIHLAAFTYFWDANYQREQYLERLLDVLDADPQAAEHNYYFDVATAHLYFQPNLIYDVVQAFREMMASHGLERPLWLVETNAPPVDDATWPVPEFTLSVTLYEQAAFIPQALATALAAGAERAAVYKLQDTDDDRAANPEPFGLLRSDGSRRPAFDTYQVAVRYLSGARQATRKRWDEVGQVALDQGDYTTTVLFARLPAPQQAEVAATAREAVLVDMWGERQKLEAEGGVFSVPLPAALCTQPIGDYCMIGGTTYYLIQAKEGRRLPDLPPHSVSPTTAPPPPAADSDKPLPGRKAGAGIVPLRRPSQQIDVVTNEAVLDFPESVTFRLELAPGEEVTEAVLNYDVAQRSCVDVSTEVPVMPDGEALEWRWVMSRSGNPPPGAQLWWEWLLTDTAGRTTTTPRKTLTFVDDRFDWRMVTAGDIHLHWYEGENVGPTLLEAAVAGVERLQAEMGITLQDDVNLFIYGDSSAMREAVLYVQDWAGGVAFGEYNTILIGVPPSLASDWGRETVRHELAHLVLSQFGWSCLGGSRPNWLEEGLASYAEGPPDEETLRDLERGIEENAFVPLRSLNGAFPAHSEEASLAYSQSYSVVAFLLEEYGKERLQELILKLAEGAGYDDALQQVYGLNVDELEVAWRQAIGAPARVIPPTPTAITAAAVPTVAPLSPARTVPTPPSAAASPPAPAPSLCGLGLAPLLLLGLVAGWRRSTRSHKGD